MSNIDDIKTLEEASPQSSWIFVEDCNVETTKNKYYLNCSTEPVTELTEATEKKDVESDSDSISVISESDDSKELVIGENEDVTDSGAKEDNVAKNTTDILYHKLYAFSCLLLAVVLPILLNYVMHNLNNNHQSYLKEYQHSPDENSDDFLKLLLENDESGRIEPIDSDIELANINVLTPKELYLYDREVKKEDNIEIQREPDIKPKIKLTSQNSDTKHSKHQNYKSNLKHIPEVHHELPSHEISKKIPSKVEKTHNGKPKRKDKTNNLKEFKQNKRYKKESDKSKNKIQDEYPCGKELSKLRQVISNQEKRIRKLNKSLKEKERQIMIIQNKIYREIKELRHWHTENNRFKHNFTQSISGEWYNSYFDQRDKNRKRTHEADWVFDRAHYRHKKRLSDKNWYINWMIQREDYRKRTDWHFSS